MFYVRKQLFPHLIGDTFVKVKNEGERVAKDTIIGYLETFEGTSLEKTGPLPIKATVAGLVSYQTDGLESFCNPEIWLQLDLEKLQVITRFCHKFRERKKLRGQENTRKMV